MVKIHKESTFLRRICVDNFLSASLLHIRTLDVGFAPGTALSRGEVCRRRIDNTKYNIIFRAEKEDQTEK